MRIVFALLALLVARVHGGEGSGLLDLQGRAVEPFEHQAKGLRVFIFVRTDCPVANAYSPELRRLHDHYAGRSVIFRLVYCDADETPAQIRRHMADYALPCSALRDPGQRFAARSKVSVTPEVAVYRSNGTLLYHGRIDDRYVDYGKSRPAPTRHDLALALDAALAGHRVPAAGGAAVGCLIRDLK